MKQPVAGWLMNWKGFRRKQHKYHPGIYLDRLRKNSDIPKSE
jgi:hypothetical protein